MKSNRQSQRQKTRDGTQANSTQNFFHFYFPAVTRYIKAYLNKLQPVSYTHLTLPTILRV
jgi:hypothetical protein